MRNIFLLIRRFHVLLIFLVLQILSVSMLVNYSNSHRARYMEVAYEVTGRINKQYTGLIRYFSLGENNRNLALENERLNNLLSQNFTVIDTGAIEKTASFTVDSSRLTRKYLWRLARVINNSVNMQNNYITLERGRKQGIIPDMAVVSPVGIVGIVTDVSENMSVVMSLLHRKMSTSVSLKKSRYNGILDWDGENPEELQLRGIPKSAEVKVGDTLITSNLSLNFPEGLMVGTVKEVELDEGATYYKIQVKPGANFLTLDYVYVIENTFLKEQQELERRASRQQ